MKRGTARAIDRSVVLLATLCLAGHSYHVPSARFWSSVLQNRSYLLLALLVVVAVFGALTPFESWRARSLSKRNVIMRRRILVTFGRILEIGNKIDPPLETGDLALHVWQRRRSLCHPVSGKLRRLSTYRMAAAPANRSFSPRKGVGAVGLCWEKDHEYTFDATEIAGKLITERDFIQHMVDRGAESVMNLTWQDFNRVKHRTALFAVPIRNGRNKFAGCLSVDASRGYQTLNQPALIEEMTKLGLDIASDDFECT
ncbi:hypothetical protein [Amycolatopsis minnesotensis]